MNSVNSSIFSKSLNNLNKSLRSNLKSGIQAMWVVGAVALTLTGARAQVYSSNLSSNLSSQSFVQLISGYPQNYNAQGGYGNPFGIANYGGYGGYTVPLTGAAVAGSNAIPLGNYSTEIPLNYGADVIPVGGGITYMNPYYGGVSVTEGNGLEFIGSRGGNPYIPLDSQANPYEGNFYRENTPVYPGYEGNNGSYSAEGRAIQGQQPAPRTLAQSIRVQQGRNYSLSFSWRGNPQQLLSMNVTLLNSLHLPVARKFGEYGNPAFFPPNANTYAARYYRVDVTYTDGTTESTQGTVKFTSELTR